MYATESLLKNLRDELRIPILVLGGSRSDRLSLVYASLKEEYPLPTDVDLLLFAPDEKGKYSIETLREFISLLPFRPFKKKRCFIFEEVDRLLPLHQNLLLKAFEEMDALSSIFLLAETSASLLLTLRSRVTPVEIATRKEESLTLDWSEPLHLFLQKEWEEISLEALLDSFAKEVRSAKSLKALSTARHSAQLGVKMRSIAEFLHSFTG